MQRKSNSQRKALHRGINDILDPEASFTSNLLERVKPETTADPTDRSNKTDQSDPAAKPAEFSTSPADSAGVSPAESAGLRIASPADSAGLQSKGFLALPHAVLDQMFAEIRQYSAFKVYLYLYREAFRRIHDERLTAKCSIPLTVITNRCGMPDRVVRDALKILIRDHWIEIENRVGASSVYIIHKPLGPAESAGPTPADSAGHLKNDHLKKDHDKERRSSSRKRLDDDDSLPVIRNIYQELTGNTWTSKDTQSYEAISETLKAEDTIRYMRAIHERTSKSVGSFAYFAKAIVREQQSPKNRKTTLNKLRKIVDSVRTANIGRSDYSTAVFREDIKEAAARDAIPYHPDLLEEALKLHP